MKSKRFLNNFLYGALLFAMGTGAVSCSDYDDDIDSLKDRVTTIESDMERFKKKVEEALNASLTVASWHASEDRTQYTIVLSNGDKLLVQASGKATPFYQFKIEEGTWRYTADKGAQWSKVLTAGTQQEIPGTDKDQLFYDKTNGSIYIRKTEELIQTEIQIEKDAPILAENRENKTLSIFIYGENYILPIQGGGFSGIGSILFQKQHAFEADEFLEAASYTDKKGNVIAAHTATARFKILPKDIDLSGAQFACADIHELLATRAAAPQLLVKALNDGSLDENGILTVELTPQDMSAGYYGAVLEITLDKTTSSSNYFVMKPTSYNANDGVWAFRDTREIYNDSQALQFVSTEGIDLSTAVGWGFGETEKVKFAEELGFDLQIEKAYEVTVGTQDFAVSEEGVLTARSADTSGKVKVSYTIGTDVLEREFTVFAQDEAIANAGIGLSSPTVSLSNLETLYKTTLRFEVRNTQTSPEALGVTASQVWMMGRQEDDGNWTVYGKPENLSTINKDSELAAGEMYLCYDAAEKKSYLLAGPRLDGISGANLFAMNAEGTDKATFTLGDKAGLGLYVGNFGARYEVRFPVKKQSLYVTIYGKGNIDQKENPNSRVRYEGLQPAIPGTYDEAKGYHFTDVALSSLYDFKPADADFTIRLNRDDQNAKTQEQWGGNFKWNETNATLTLSNTYELANYNTLNKKVGSINEAADKPGIHISWEFKAGETEAQQAKSDGNERWFIKDPVRQPGENVLYFGFDKQPCATGVILGTDGSGAKENPVPYSAKLANAIDDPNKTKFDQLQEGDVLDVGKALGQVAIWRSGILWDVYGGPNGNIDFTQPLPLPAPLALPPLLKYDEASGKIVITDYCKKYFCKTKGVLRVNLHGSEANDHFEIVSAEDFILRVKAGSGPVEHGNIQLRIEFNTDYANQIMYIHLAN
jgi:hypothetical protein